jgi:adenosylcobinamide-GDP ribazoletransferase
VPAAIVVPMLAPALLFRPLALAATTLSVARLPVHGEVSAEDLRTSTVAYPLVGMAIGLLPAGALLLPLPDAPRAALALAAWVCATGALHLDGWGDCCDAAFAPPKGDAQATRARRLEILKDPRMGVFGVVGIGLLLLAKWSALMHVPAMAPLVAAVVARWAMVFALRAYAPARRDGLGAAFGAGVPLWGATVVAVALLVWLTLQAAVPMAAAAAVCAGIVAAVAAGGFLTQRFGGMTGDVCGAMGEAAELAALWAFLPAGAA